MQRKQASPCQARPWTSALKKVYMLSFTVLSQNKRVRSKMEDLSQKPWKRKTYSDTNRQWVIYISRLCVDKTILVHIQNFHKPNNSKMISSYSYTTQSTAKSNTSIGALGVKQAAASCSALRKQQVVFRAATAYWDETCLTF